PIGEHPVWRVTDYAGRNPEWLTFVDGRFVVRASSPELLASALARTGRRERLLAFAPKTSAFAEDASEFLLLQPRPQPEQAAHYRPGLRCSYASPDTVVLAQLFARGEGGRLQLLGASQPEIEGFVQRWSAEVREKPSPSYVYRGLHAIDLELDGASLWLSLLFGLHMFL
ncbi:MAG: hypothetical protein ABIP94_01970, partial [Planctomycetota bacterium]